jgi:hypothetical protein
MMPLKYLKDFDCWNLLSLVAHGRLEDGGAIRYSAI